MHDEEMEIEHCRYVIGHRRIGEQPITGKKSVMSARRAAKSGGRVMEVAVGMASEGDKKSMRVWLY